MTLRATRQSALALAAAILWLLAPAAVRAAAAPGASGGETAHVSYSRWTVDGASVRLDFLLPRTAARGFVAPGAPLPFTSVVAAAVAANVAVESAGGACEAIDQGEGAGRIYVMAPTPTLYRFEIIFACPRADGIVLHDHVLFARFPDQVNYAQVRIDGGGPAIQLFTQGRQTLALPAGNRPPQASLLRFAMQGAEGVTGQADRLCVVFGLLLLVRRWRDLGAVAIALGAGYLASIAMALGGLGLSDRSWSGAVTGLAVLLLGAGALRLRPPGPAPPRGWRIAAIVALSVMLTAAVAIGAVKDPSEALAVGGLAVFGAAQVWVVGADAGLRWIAFAPAALFALSDGALPAQDLATLKTPAAQAVPRLLAYDLGATVVAALLVAIAVAGLWLAARRIAAARRALAIDLGAASLIGLGLFWFVSRIY
ncbi:MAG TPA: hypothetical protein VIJ94_18245 [Caulobacteraceae bacterium]